MFRLFQKLSVKAEGHFIPIDREGITHHGMFRTLAWETIVTSLIVNGPAGIRTIGTPSNPRFTSTDKTACPTFESCGSGAPRQITPVIKLIPIHNIV